MKLALEAARGELASIELGDPNRSGYFEEGDLGSTAGNLYILLDGVEWGSLFFYRREDGTMTVALGQFSPDTSEWEEAGELTHPVDTSPI